MNLDDINFDDPQSLIQLEDFLKSLPKDEQQEILRAVSPKSDNIEARIPPPLPGPQTRAIESDAFVTGYGGAAGGGKTYMAVMMALTQHQRTLYIRKEAAQLHAVKDEISEIVGSTEGLNTQTGIWNVPNGKKKRQVRFGGVNNPGDEKKYQGAPRDLLVIDEACNVPEKQVRFLMGWTRTTDPDQRCRVLLPSNPPTDLSVGQWYIDYFSPWLEPTHPDPAEDGEIRWFATIDGKDIEVETEAPFRDSKTGDMITPQSRTFIKSKVTDNPYLMGTAYYTTLQALPEPLRSQMLNGDFLAGIEDDQWQVCPTQWVIDAMDRWEDKVPACNQTAIGVDVSRGGRDESIIAKLYGDWFDELIRLPGHSVPDGPTLGSEVLRVRRNNSMVGVDAIGVGSSVVDFFSSNAVKHIPLTGSESGIGTDKTGTYKFKNLRAEMHWRFREALDPQNNPTIKLPPDSKLRADLTAPNFTILEGNVLKVESKQDIFKRLKRSTDSSDAIIYAWYCREQVKFSGEFQGFHDNFNINTSWIV